LDAHCEHLVYYKGGGEGVESRKKKVEYR
jgi:hypothetical protein